MSKKTPKDLKGENDEAKSALDGSKRQDAVKKKMKRGLVLRTWRLASLAVISALVFTGNFGILAASATGADLSITMSDAPDPVLTRRDLTYTITAKNLGPSTASGVQVSDQLRADVVFVRASSTRGTCSFASSTVTCSIGSLAKSAAAQISLVVQATVPGTLTNSASVKGTMADPKSSNNSATVTTVIKGQADLSAAISDSPDPVVVGRDLTYTIAINNAGPDGASGVKVVDSLPSSVGFQSATSSQGSCTGTSTVTCSLGVLLSGAGATVRIVVRPITAGIVTNTATTSASETDPASGNNSATLMTTVSPPVADLAVEITDDPDPYIHQLHDEFVYTVTVRNIGPDPAPGVVLTDRLAFLLEFLGASAGCTYTVTPPWPGKVVTCNLGELPAGGAASIQIRVRPPDLCDDLKVDYFNTATVSSSASDPNSNNNAAEERTTVLNLGDLLEVCTA
jgi:uncharacterized repeat protein (TIGR01451 family)